MAIRGVFIASGGQIADGAIGTAQLAAGAVTDVKVNASGITTASKVPTAMQFKLAGVAKTLVSMDDRVVAGPASYALGGVPVDLSATYSTILRVSGGYWRIAGGGVTNTNRFAVPSQTGTDVFTGAKFRVTSLVGNTTPAGSVAAPAFTGSPVSTSAPVASAACIGTCNQNHPNLSALTVTAAGSNSAPAFTGTNDPTAIKQEVTTTNLSTLEVVVTVVAQ